MLTTPTPHLLRTPGSPYISWERSSCALPTRRHAAKQGSDAFDVEVAELATGNTLIHDYKYQSNRVGTQGDTLEHIIIKVNEDARKVEWSFDEWMERGLKWWRTRADRVISCTYAVVVDASGTVSAIGEVIGVRKDRNHNPVRIAIEIEPQRDSPLLGKRIAVNASRNPIEFTRDILYLDE